MKKHKLLFSAMILALSSFCHPCPAQTTTCGEDNGCYAYYMKITKTSPTGNACTNDPDTYVVLADVRTGQFPPFSITVDGAAFSLDGQQYLPGQWVDFVGATVFKNCSNDNNRDYSFQRIQKTVSVERTEKNPWTIKVKSFYTSVDFKICTYFESQLNTCIKLRSYDLCVYRNRGGDLTVDIAGTFASGGYLYEWKKYDWDTQEWATVESGSGTSTTQTLELPKGQGYKTEMYRFRMKPGIQPWVHSATAYVRNVPMDCPVP